MSASALSSLFELFESSTINQIASRLGEPPRGLSRVLQSATALLVDGLANRSRDPEALSQIYNLTLQAPSDVDISYLTDAALSYGRASGATSKLLDAGRKLVTLAFGDEQPSVMDALTRFVGLRPPLVSTLMAVAASILASSLARAMRKEQMTRSQLTNLLLEESTGIQNLLPPALQRDTDRPQMDRMAESRQQPFSITTVREEPRSGMPDWLWVLPLLLSIPLLVWLFNRVSAKQVTEAGRKMAENIGTSETDLGNFAIRRLPRNVDLNLPPKGTESKLLAFIQDRTRAVDQATWLEFDRLSCDADSARLSPETQEQIRNIAMILKAYPNVQIIIGGCTDNTRDAQHDLQFVQARAGGVAAELITLGISPDRLETQTYGDQYPRANNYTEVGRAKNRHVFMRVVRK